MTEIIGVRFKQVGKMYYFSPKDSVFKKGQFVIVETARGIEMGEVVLENKQVEDDKIISPLKPVLRAATNKDLEKAEYNKAKEREAFEVCLKKIAEHKLEMKLIDVEYTFDNNKILFYFTADGRIDFRELVKDLASQFRTRIELRQIGVRDEAKMQGGLGICGKPFCCSTFLGEFAPVSIKMAKEQGLSLNPTKISGTCGRLMCCLKYEQDAYEELIALTPKVGALVQTPDYIGLIIETNLLTGEIKVRSEDNPDTIPKIYHRSKINVIRDVEQNNDTPDAEDLNNLSD